MFLLRLSLRPWRLAPVSQVSSAAAVGVLLLLVGFLAWMQAGLKPVVARLQGEQVVTAYLATDVESQDESRVLDQVRQSLGAQAISEIRLVGTQEFISNLKGQYPDLSRELQELGSETRAIVPRYVSISGMLANNAVDSVKLVSGIESAESSKDRYAHIVGAFSALRWVAKVLGVGLILALFTGLIHLSRMNAYLHQDALSVLRIWGATELTLRAPSMISGVIVGALGGFLASAGWLTAASWLVHHVRSLSPMLRDLPSASFGWAAALMLGGMLVGLFAGAIGGMSSDVAAAEAGR